jgi:transcriptional regulator with XRE-family HTH domain
MRGRISIAVAEGGSITPDQCREARVQLGVTQERLAELSGVGQSYASSFERIGRVPHSRTGRNYVAEIRAALEAAGAVFTDGGEPGREAARTADGVIGQEFPRDGGSGSLSRHLTWRGATALH